jgi:hypothetical protein
MTLQTSVLDALSSAGLASAPWGLHWHGLGMDLEVLPNGRAILVMPVHGAKHPVGGAVALLSGNPETGWAWGLTAHGLVRRLTLDPSQWMDPGACAEHLQALASARGGSVRAAARETLLPIVAEDEIELPSTEEAIARILLVRDGEAVDGCRHCVVRGGRPSEATLVGPDARAVQRRLREERPLLAALLARRDLVPSFLELWPLDPTPRRTS